MVKAWFQTKEALEQAQRAVGALRRRILTPAASPKVAAAFRDEAWEDSWKQHFHPIHVGRFVIRPSWEAYQPKDGDRVIDMDPGMAFGTGWHETTRLCLSLIERHYQGGRGPDVGTGSGILALALGKLGAREVLGVDIDEAAVKAARDNVALNQLQDGDHHPKGSDLTRGIEGSFPLPAPIFWRMPLLCLAPSLKPLMRQEGIFVASGIVKDREQDVVEALTAGGWRLLDSAHEGRLVRPRLQGVGCRCSFLKKWKTGWRCSPLRTATMP